MVTLKLYKEQIEKLLPLQKVVEERSAQIEADRKVDFGVEGKFAILAQVYPDRGIINCHLLSSEKVQRIKEIIGKIE